MVRREIEIDEETDRILSELAAQHDGNLSEVLADLVHAHEGLEAFVEAREEVQGSALRAPRLSRKGFHPRVGASGGIK